MKRFNTRVAKCRYVNEHCIGLLKGRFQLLRGMRTDISLKKGALFMILMIRCAGVLHNLLLNDTDSDWNEILDCDITDDQPDLEHEEIRVCSTSSNGEVDRRKYHTFKFIAN